MRTLVIGDLHSGVKALEQVLDRAQLGSEDQLIFLGDYVDGWSQAVQTIDFLIDLHTSHKCILLRGNHDQLAHDWLRTNEENRTWLLHGGLATKESYEKVDNARKRRHMDFFESLRDYYLDAENRLFLHAGYTNMHGVEHEYFSKMFYWDRTLWETALSLDPKMSPGDAYYPKRLENYTEIYIGHTPVTRIGKTVPHQAANVWNIDTGAAFKGPLSVVDVDTKEVWQSDPVHTFYPGEKGRN